MNHNFENLLKKYYTARIDIKSFGHPTNQIVILENSDLNAEISSPDWFKDNSGIGTSVTSGEGVLNLKIKCINDGELKITLRGLDVRDKNKRRFPVYIDFTKLSVNDTTIFDESKLLWHDQPYTFSKIVSNSEIIDIHIQWLPFNLASEFDAVNSHDLVISLKEKLSMREKQIKSIPQLSYTTLGYDALDGKLTYRNYHGNHSKTILDDWEGYCDNIWFTRYLKHKFPDEDFKINIFGVFNPHDNLAYPMEGKKVLYSMEDLNTRFLEMKCKFNKYALDYVDFALGYDFVDNHKYLRFPYWIIRHFFPESTEEDIEKKVDLWKNNSFEKTKDVTVIANHDWGGTRAIIANDISEHASLLYAGKWRKNTSELQVEYKNNKFNFLRKFKFNICPENLLIDAYVTEKIFDAIESDCIPLYAGGGDYLEPKIINQNAIIRWDGEKKCGYDSNLNEEIHLGRYAKYPIKYVVNDDRNSDSVELFKNLISDEKTYKEFKDQDRVLDSSAKYIIKIMSDLEKHFERLIYS